MKSSANLEMRISTLTLLKGIWFHLSQRRRIQLCLLVFVMLISGAAELLSLGVVMPFLTVLSDPESLWNQPLVQVFIAHLGYTHPRQLVIPITIAFALAALFAAILRLFNLWFSGRLSAAIGSDLSCDAYRRTLYQPYEVHLQRNSASVIASTTTQIGTTVAGLSALLQLTTALVIAFGLFTGLLLVDPVVAVSAAALFGGAYSSLAVTSRRELQINSYKISSAVGWQLKALQEGLGAIRDVLLDGTQNSYLQIYSEADRPLRQLQAKNSFLSAFPRYTIEALGMVAIAVLGGLLVLQNGVVISVIPLLGTFALGAQRLLPALQQIYGGWAALKGYQKSIHDVLEMLNQPLPVLTSSRKSLLLKKNICFSEVRFRYTNDSEEVLRSINFEIQRGERIGVIGTTGSGKSTTIDLLMGLLVPSSGKIYVDGIDLHDPVNHDILLAWRSSIAHVPQSIYLADSSIAENIAFGVPEEKIDFEKVRKVAKQAQISSYIECMPEAYETFVGERGIRLSGGQRQRIGIARALYKEAQILVLDEATSALDNSTEQAIMTTVNSLSKELTVVMIAHRLSTIQNCDRLIKLENGIVISNVSPQADQSSK